MKNNNWIKINKKESFTGECDSNPIYYRPVIIYNKKTKKVLYNYSIVCGDEGDLYFITLENDIGISLKDVDYWQSLLEPPKK